MGAVQSRDFPMQPRAWYIHPPTGQPFGPCYTQSQAQIEAVRVAVRVDCYDLAVQFRQFVQPNPDP